MPQDEKPVSDPGPPPPARVMSVNQLVSYNLMRARRAHGWTQGDVADLLSRYTGRKWSNASVSAAERAWQGGRPRRFDASEIAAVAQIFDEPISYFFLPPEGGRYSADWVAFGDLPAHVTVDDVRDGTAGVDLTALLRTSDLLEMALIPASPPVDFVRRVQELTLQWFGMIWDAPEWRSGIREIKSLEDLGADEGEDDSVELGRAILGIKAGMPISEILRRAAAALEQTEQEQASRGEGSD